MQARRLCRGGDGARPGQGLPGGWEDQEGVGKQEYNAEEAGPVVSKGREEVGGGGAGGAQKDTLSGMVEPGFLYKK